MHQTNTIRNMKILNSRETKHVLEKLNEQYGFDDDKLKGYIFLMNKDNRIYIISREIAQIPFDEMKIDSIGLYFGELYKDSLRMSIEACQLIGKESTKNIVDLTYNQLIEWIKGNNLDFEDTGKEFVIVRYVDPHTKQEDYVGCGKYKGGKLMNYVSKSRKLVVVND